MLISSVPIDLTPVSVVETGDAIEVDWGDHVSHYTAAWFDDVIAQVARRHPPAEAWGAGFEPVRFDHHTVLADTAVELELLETFGRYGAVIISNTPTEPGSLESIIRRWAPPIEVPFDLVHDVYVDPAGYNVAHTAEPLPPHNDMAGQLQSPSGQVLHMLVNEATGGASILVDGLAAAASLSESDRGVLCGLPVAFRQFSSSVETWARAPVLHRNTEGMVDRIRYSNQLLQAIDPTDPRTDDWYRAYHRLSAIISDPSRQARFRLDSGDLLMVHGHRVLHGRTGFEENSGPRHLQDIYFEYDDVMNEYWRLAR